MQSNSLERQLVNRLLETTPICAPTRTRSPGVEYPRRQSPAKRTRLESVQVSPALHRWVLDTLKWIPLIQQGEEKYT